MHKLLGGNKTFNNNVTAASFIKSGGIAAQFLKADGSVDNNSYLTANQPIVVTATGDATGVSISSATAPVLPLTLATVNSAVGTFGNNITIPSITVNNKGLITDVIANPIPTATATTSGLLSTGDWNTFNNKQNAIPTGTTAQYFRGDLSLGNFTNDVRSQFSAGTNITYANGNIGLTNNSITLNTIPLTLGGSQSFATGSTGNDFNISSVGTVHSFNIPNASATTRGLLTSSDFSNFNTAFSNRITGLTTTGTSGPASLSGNVLNIPNYTLAGLGGISNSTTVNGLSLSSNQTFSSGNLGTDFNIVSSGTNHAFNLPTASSGARGLLSSSDWSTFNNKQAAISGAGYAKWNGSIINFNSQIPLGSDVSGTLSATNFGQLTGDVTNTPGSYATTISNNTITTAKIVDGAVSNIKLANKSITFNGLPVELGSSQTLLAGSDGSDFNIKSIGSTHTFNLPSASASARGLLTSADWSNFNSKQAGISGTGYSKWTGSNPSFNATIPLDSDVSGILLATNFGQLTGDVTNAPGSYATTIANNAITNAKILNGTITNDKLASNGSFTLGSTGISLGTTTTTVAGLTLSAPTINLPAIYYTNTPTGLTAGDNSQGSLNLTNDINIVTTAAASSAVTLPVAQAGRQVIIVNRGANAINVFPGSSARINALPINAAFSNIPANSYAEFFATASSQWYSANSIATATSSWNILGNSGIDESKNFIGTTDPSTLKFRVANTFAGQINKSITVGNTSFGFDSNDSDGAGDFNSAFGHSALNAITVGHQNSGFGAGALAKTNAGNDNTAVGQGALTENLSGDNNTGVGQGSLNKNQTGTSNVAIGQASLRSLVNTNNNTAVGRASVENITTGTNNTAVGYIAGRNFGTTFSALETNIATSLTESVMIGSQTRPSSSGSQNEIVIGFDAYGAGNNTVQLGNTSIIKVNTSGSMNAAKFVGTSSKPPIAHNILRIDNATPPTIEGNDVAGYITFTTGASPTGTGDFITVTFTSPYLTKAPVVLINPVINTGTRGIATSIYCLPSSTTTGAFIISTGLVLLANTEYQIAYHVIGR